MPNVPLDDLVELASEFRLQTVFDHLAVGSTITAPDGRLLRVNTAFTELLGYDEEDLVGRTFQSLTHPDDLAANGALFGRALAGELDRYRLEKRFLHARGHAVWVQLTASVIRDARGAARYFVSQYEDLTDRRAARARLGESEERYRTVVDAAHEGICTVDAVGRITYVNRRLASMLDYSRGELLGRPVFDLMEPETAFDARTQFARRQRGIAEHADVALRRKDGTTLWALSSVSSLFGADGAFQGAVYLLTDVTGRREAEQRLAESERYFRALTEQSCELVCVLDADGVTRYANPGFSRVLGFPNDEVVGRSALAFVYEDDVQRIRALFGALLHRPGGYVDATYRMRSRAGAVYRVSAIAQNLLDDPAVRGIVVNAQDITERSRASDALRESEARFQHIVNNVPGVVYQWTYNPDWTGGYTYVSEGARALFGVAPDEALRDPSALLGLLPPPERDALRKLAREAATTLRPFRWEGRAVLPTGEVRVIQIAAHDQRLADGTVLSDGVIMDMTAQRKLEAQLQQAQKMEAVGQLAGGIAHDFNNLLTVISSFTIMALESLSPETTIHADLTEVRQAADRAAELTRQLLAFGRKQVLQPQALDVNDTVTEVLGMLRRLIAEDITFQVELGHELWLVLADPGQLSQVLMNLAVNARDAMPDGGTLRLATENVTIAPTQVHDRPGLEPGHYVSIVVEDTGNGIAPAVMAHLFEPFFTTKGPGHGTGLGLATVYGIVKQSGGHVYADSVAGAGARFTVLLPRVELSLVEERGAPKRTVHGGTETILLVEDERAVRGAVRRMLTFLGYHVLEAESAADALRLATEVSANGARIDLVLTDVVMPKQGGRALGEQIAARWPDMPVMYMSGYTDDEILRRGLRHSRLLEKPFTPEQLAKAIRDALDAERH